MIHGLKGDEMQGNAFDQEAEQNLQILKDRATTAPSIASSALYEGFLLIEELTTCNERFI